MITSLAMTALLAWRLVSQPGVVNGGGQAQSSVSGTPSEGRDPFAPVQDAGGAREATPLERFAVRDLRLVATVEGVEPPRALIEDPNGLGFVVAPGSIVGAERSTVVSIDGGRVVLETSRGDPNRVILTLAGKTARTEGR